MTIWRLGFQSLLVLSACSALAGIYFWQAQDGRFYSVRSGSMSPAIAVGDLVIDKQALPGSLKNGDVVSYVSSANSGTVITHRIVAVDRQAGTVTTRGDSLRLNDTPVPYAAVLGKTVFVLPLAGYLLDGQRNPLGLICLVYIPVIAIGIVEAKKLGGGRRRAYKHGNLL